MLDEDRRVVRGEVRDRVRRLDLVGHVRDGRAEVLRRIRVRTLGVGSVVTGRAEVLVEAREGDRPEPVDHGLDRVRLVRVDGVRAAQGGRVAGGAGECRQIAAGGVTPESDAGAVEPVLVRVGAHPADGGLDVVDGRREESFRREPVVQADDGVAAREALQHRQDLPVPLVAGDEPAAVDADQHRVRRLAGRRKIQVEPLRRRVLRVGDVTVDGARAWPARIRARRVRRRRRGLRARRGRSAGGVAAVARRTAAGGRQGDQAGRQQGRARQSHQGPQVHGAMIPGVTRTRRRPIGRGMGGMSSGGRSLGRSLRWSLRGRHPWGHPRL